MDKLNKRAFHLLIDHLQGPVTWSPLVDFNCWPYFNVHRIIHTFSFKSQYLEILKHLAIEMNPNKVHCINTTGQIRCQTLQSKRSMYGKQNGKCTEWSHKPSLQTISHFPVLPGCFVNTYCHCCDSDFVQLFNLVFHYGPKS